MVRQKAADIPGIALSSLKGKTSLHKSPAFIKIYHTINEISQNTQNPAQASQHIETLCDELIANMAIPPSRSNDSSYGSSFAFKTHVALIRQINSWLLSHTMGDHRRVNDLLNRQLLSRIRQYRNDTIKKNRYLLVLWMLKFPLIEQTLKRKKMQYKEDLYQGSYSILLRCVERCNPERTESFNAYFAKALQWNIPRILWQIKNEKELLVGDRIINEGRAGREVTSPTAALQAAEGKEGGKKEILDNLLLEWWHKVKAGVKQLTGKHEFSLDAIQEAFFILKTARQEKSQLWELSKVKTLLHGKTRNSAVKNGVSTCFEEGTEFIRHVTLIYIAYRMLKQGKNQAQIARELQLSRERIRQYVQLWVKPYIKSKLKKIGLATARHTVSEAYSKAKKQHQTARFMLQRFFAEDPSINPPPLITRVNPSKFIKLFNLTIRFPKHMIVPGQKLKISAEVFGKENRLIMRTFSHNENVGWCLTHWDTKKDCLVSSTGKTTVSLIPYKIPEEQLQKQVYRHFVKAVRRGILAEPPAMKLKIKTFAKYPCIATAVFGKSSSLYLNLTDTFYVFSIIGVELNAPVKSILVKFEAVDKQNHVEYKQIILSGNIQWHYRALIAKEDEAGNLLFYPLGERNVPPIHFDYMYHEAKHQKSA